MADHDVPIEELPRPGRTRTTVVIQTDDAGLARWLWLEIRQLTDVSHCNLQHHLS